MIPHETTDRLAANGHAAVNGVVRRVAAPKHRDRPRVNADPYAELLANIQRPVGPAGQLPQVVGVTSCTRREGVSTVAANLALTAAQSLGKNVLLVDARVSRPTLHQHLASPRSPGLSEYLAGAADLADCLFQCDLECLTLLPAGNVGNVSDHAEATSVTPLLEAIRADFWLVVIDLPPVDELGDCWLLAGHLDGTVLVLAAERVAAHTARRAAERLLRAGVRLLGAVFNGVR